MSRKKFSIRKNCILGLIYLILWTLKLDDVRKILLLSLLFGMWGALFSQENCENIADYPLGRQLTYQWYSVDEKPSYQTFHTVIRANADGPTDSDIRLTILNSFQDTVYEGDYQVRCTPEGLYQDLLAKLTPDMLSSLAGLELRTEEQGWVLPAGMNPGDSIPQSYSHVSGYADDTKIMELDLAIGPVLILAQENLSTPAGGFPCVAMAYELWVTQVVRKRFRLRDWFAPDVGVVRREVFDRRGKFYGHCELISWK